MDSLLLACENLVANVSDLVVDPDDTPISVSDIARWQGIFGFTLSEAEAEIRAWRSNLGRERLNTFAWNAVKDSIGEYDKESYEYALATQRLPTARDSSRDTLLGSNPKPKDGISIVPNHTSRNLRFLLKLEGELRTTTAVQAAGNLNHPPSKYYGENEDGERAEFCIVDTTGKQSIQKGLTDRKSTTQPFFVRLPEAEKDLSATSHFPTLGIDTTMPQNRLDKAHPRPGQDEYPVWYFFYGTLAEQDTLSRLLQRGGGIDASELPPAYIFGGKTTTLGRYRALVHGDMNDEPVIGSAFLVKSREEEDALRYYETELYTVVRCGIHILLGDGSGKNGTYSEVHGLTFMSAA
ncbi:hypothetical protein F5Y16DRAFT_386211 [Xylariaceae sp. FL0255]|nr:hypothetical protein F5Y16DRAFT_386211 [Xylariaceae sp. FL0255]